MSETTSGDGKALEDRTVPELKQYADDQGIELGGATKKADILAVIANGGPVEDEGGTNGNEPGTGHEVLAGQVDPATGVTPAPGETRLDDDVTSPSTVAPGDAPYDTTDPTEEATTVGGDKAAAARDGHGTVNAVLPVKRANPRRARKTEDRIERYEATRPNGEVIEIERNIDTGAQTIVG